MAGFSEILSNPENQKYFIWTPDGLKLTGNPPRSVVNAWVALAATQPRRPRFSLSRRVQLLRAQKIG